MQIHGIGNDIIEIERIKEALEKHDQAFIEKVLTPKEILNLEKHQSQAGHLAGRFAAKEAISKALGTGFGAMLGFHDIEISNEESGKPTVTFSEKAKKNFHQPTVLLSIAHCHTYASAFAIWIS